MLFRIVRATVRHSGLVCVDGSVPGDTDLAIKRMMGLS